MSGQIEKGAKIGQYEIMESLGKGGMASVYRAFQPSLEREVAIKLMAEQFATDPTFVERFRREARSIARLRHPNILTVYDAGEEKGLLYIVMELIEGPTLKEITSGKPLPVDRAINYIQQVAGALDYANKQGIIHRDVKPSNVLIDQNSDRAILSDFGIAKSSQSGNSQLTSTGTGIGTPDYMSPEQAMGDELDARSDQYSLAVVLYELLTGRPPFSGDTPIAVVMGHVSKPLPSAILLNPQIPPGVEAVLIKAMAKKAVDRYETCGAFSQALQEAWRNRTKGGPAGVNGVINAPTQVLSYDARPQSGSFEIIAEAEQQYNEARRLEQINNFQGAFEVFKHLNTRFASYRDVPALLERYRAMGYEQGQPTGWQMLPGSGTGSVPYGTPPSGPYSMPRPQNVTNPPPAAGATGALYGAAPVAPARKKSNLLAVALVIGAAVVVGLVILLLTGDAPASSRSTSQNAGKAPTSTAGGPNPVPSINIALPTRRPVLVPTPRPGNPVQGPLSNRFVTYKDPAGFWSAEIPDNWEASPDEDGGITLAPKNNTLTAAIYVLSESIDESDTTITQPWVDSLVKSYLQGYGAKIDREEKRQVDGVEGNSYLGTLSSNGLNLQLRLTSVVKKDRLYLVLYTGLPIPGNREPLYERFLDTMKLR